MLQLISIISLIPVLFSGNAVQGPEFAPKIPNHTLWTEMLSKHVDEFGHVDYKTWKEDQDLLDQYLHLLSGPLPLSNWSQNVQLSYWINLHNAYLVKLVLENYPTNALCDSLHDQWMIREWIKLDTTMYSLQQIRDKISDHFTDERVHFAIHLAAKSSAPLRNEAYVPGQLNDQLENQATEFVNNPRFNQVSDSTLLLSELFQWHAQDFRPDVLSYFNHMHQDTVFHQKEIQYMKFDWTLNDQSVYSEERKE